MYINIRSHSLHGISTISGIPLNNWQTSVEFVCSGPQNEVLEIN